ncbi:hypothetical protein [Bradyrhizobium sp. JR3.5]
MADVATVLFLRFLKFDVAHPDWPDRGRFARSVRSAAHMVRPLDARLNERATTYRVVESGPMNRAQGATKSNREASGPDHARALMRCIGSG